MSSIDITRLSILLPLLTFVLATNVANVAYATNFTVYIDYIIEGETVQKAVNQYSVNTGGQIDLHPCMSGILSAEGYITLVVDPIYVYEYNEAIPLYFKTEISRQLAPIIANIIKNKFTAVLYINSSAQGILIPFTCNVTHKEIIEVKAKYIEEEFTLSAVRITISCQATPPVGMVAGRASFSYNLRDMVGSDMRFDELKDILDYVYNYRYELNVDIRYIYSIYAFIKAVYENAVVLAAIGPVSSIAKEVATYGEVRAYRTVYYMAPGNSIVLYLKQSDIYTQPVTLAPTPVFQNVNAPQYALGDSEYYMLLTGGYVDVSFAVPPPRCLRSLVYDTASGTVHGGAGMIVVPPVSYQMLNISGNLTAIEPPHLEPTDAIPSPDIDSPAGIAVTILLFALWIALAASLGLATGTMVAMIVYAVYGVLSGSGTLAVGGAIGFLLAFLYQYITGSR